MPAVSASASPSVWLSACKTLFPTIIGEVEEAGVRRSRDSYVANRDCGPGIHIRPPGSGKMKKGSLLGILAEATIGKTKGQKDLWDTERRVAVRSWVLYW